MSVNKVIIIGNLGQDPDVRHTQSGDPVANVSIATTEKWSGADGEKHEKTEWHRVVFFKRLAEIAGQYLVKGSLVYVEGRIQTRKWQDNQGVEKYTTEIVGKEMKMLGSRPRQENTGPATESPIAPPPENVDPNDDIPF